MARFWYSYASGDPRVASSYSLSLSKPTCINGPVMCAIYAGSGGENPDGPLSANLQRYISAALVTKIAQPQDTNVFKKYVYVKSAQ